MQSFMLLGLRFCSLITVDVDASHLYPDENFFNTKGIVYVDDMVKMQEQAKNSKDMWKESLEKVNLVCHEGEVPVMCIVEEKTFPISDSLYYGFVKHFDEPTIEDFDRAFNIFLRTAHLWDDPFEEIVKNFEIVPIYDEAGTVAERRLSYKGQQHILKETS
jgi:hypothetical protein